MKLTAHQPVYLPWLGLFEKIARADLFCVLDTVQFGKKSFENRNFIKTQAGALMLTVPVESQDHFTKKGGEIRVVKTGWARKHCRSIELAYCKAPYFNDYFVPLATILMRGHDTLAELNRELLDFALKVFGITTPVVVASDYDFQGEKSELILDMCRKLGADTYVFGSLGKNYASEPAFYEAGIEVEFQDYRHPVYQQLHGEFTPNMSAIDLLFNHGERSREILLNG